MILKLATQVKSHIDDIQKHQNTFLNFTEIQFAGNANPPLYTDVPRFWGGQNSIRGFVDLGCARLHMRTSARAHAYKPHAHT